MLLFTVNNIRVYINIKHEDSQGMLKFNFYWTSQKWFTFELLQDFQDLNLPASDQKYWNKKS